MEEYRASVFQVNEAQEEISIKVSEMVYEYFNIDQEFFDESFNKAFDDNPELYDKAKNQIIKMKIDARKKQANQLQRQSGSPRSIALIEPRELNKHEITRIFYREQELREQFIQELSETPAEKLLESQYIYDTQLKDILHDEFNMESEDYNKGIELIQDDE